MLVSLNSINAEDVTDNSTSPSNNIESIDVTVNYEYKSDINQIHPDFYISNNGVNIKFNESNINNVFKLKFLNGSSDMYNVTVMSAGYITQSKLINITNINTLNFDLKATAAYKLGRDVTAEADKKLNFNGADDILVVTTAGLTKLDGKTSEDAVEGILNYGHNIKYSNVYMLRDTAVGPIDFAFIVKKGNALTAIIFENGSRKYSYLGTISENMTREQWNNYFKSLKNNKENAWAFASLANGWAAGVSQEILQEAAFHGHICEGTLGGYSMVKAILAYYPPIQETSTAGATALDKTSYKVVGVPGGSDDDAFLFFFDATIGKTSYVGVNSTVNDNMVGIIRWDGARNRGDLIIVSLDSDKVKALFKKETGINPNAGSLEELKYNTWWINKINTDPTGLVDFLYEFTNLTAEQYYYIVGTAVNVKDEYGDDVEPVNAHGLDMDYILSLNLPKATRAIPGNNTVGNLTNDEIKQIGKDAANKALEIIKSELGIDISKDDVDFAVLTSAGYTFLNGQDTTPARDGLYEVLGTSVFSKDLLSIHRPLWKPLWFAFVIREPNSDILNAIYLRYNANGTFFVGEYNGSNVADIGINTLNNSKKSSDLQKTFIPDGNWFNIQTIANAWFFNPNFDQIATILYHNHICPGVQPGFFISDYIHNNLTLNENESYTYIASSIYCKDDSLTYLLGLSPGLGNYYVQKLTDTTSDAIEGGKDEGVLIIWDNKLNIGRAIIISYKGAGIDTSKYATSEAKRFAQIKAYIDLYKGNKNPNVLSNVNINTDQERWITQEQFDLIKKGVFEDNLNTLTYLKSLDPITKEELLEKINGNKEPNNPNNPNHSNNGVVSNSSSHVQSSSNSASSSSSVGLSNVAKSTADTSQAEAASDDGESKGYEISKKTANKSIDSNNLIYAIAIILILGVLGGIGYLKYKKED